MWIADKWKDYEVIDTSEGEKLERFGKYILLRPDPQVIWKTEKTNSNWSKLNAHYHRSAKGGGEWEFFNLPERWQIAYKDLFFHLQPFQFKHTGIFPEQAVNWDWMREKIKRARQKDPKQSFKILNLFAYTGGATMALAKEGYLLVEQGGQTASPVSLTHVDASKGMVSWAKENAHASGLSSAPIRFIVDDCQKFVEREIRRGNFYDAIIMDPPSYGRGPKGEIWKLEESLHPFLKLCVQLLTKKPLFFLINSYTTGLQPAVLSYLLGTELCPRFSGKVTAEEIGLPVTQNGLILPCGASGRWEGQE